MKPMKADNSATPEQVIARVEEGLKRGERFVASPKLDGVRGFNKDGMMLSNNLKLLKNELLQETWGWSRYLGYDGEFAVGDPTDKNVFQKTMSVVNSQRKPVDDLKFYAFDNMDVPATVPWDERFGSLQGDNLVVVLPHIDIDRICSLLQFEEEQLGLGYEGLIVRRTDGLYKYGRSTLNEGWLLKLKRFSDSEAVVIGFEEKMHNANEKTLVKNGKAHRSSHAAGLVPLGTLGALRVRWCDVEFNIGSGWDHAVGQHIWDNQHLFRGRTCTFKYFDYGIVDAPRHPVFKGWRDGKI